MDYDCGIRLRVWEQEPWRVLSKGIYVCWPQVLYNCTCTRIRLLAAVTLQQVSFWVIAIFLPGTVHLNKIYILCSDVWPNVQRLWKKKDTIHPFPSAFNEHLCFCTVLGLQKTQIDLCICCDAWINPSHFHGSCVDYNLKALKISNSSMPICIASERITEIFSLTYLYTH